MAENVVVNPMTPKDILDTIRTSKNRSGDLTQVITDFTVLVPSGGLVAFTLTVPQDSVNIFYNRHTITSDFYDENLTLDAIGIDLTQEALSFSSIAIDSTKELDILYFNSFAIQFFWRFRNNTLTPANVTVFLELINMEVSFYENWYRLLIQNSEKHLDDIVVSLGGESRI